MLTCPEASPCYHFMDVQSITLVSFCVRRNTTPYKKGQYIDSTHVCRQLGKPGLVLLDPKNRINNKILSKDDPPKTKFQSKLIKFSFGWRALFVPHLIIDLLQIYQEAVEISDQPYHVQYCHFLPTCGCFSHSIPNCSLSHRIKYTL